MIISTSSLHKSPLPQIWFHIIHLRSRQEDREQRERERGRKVLGKSKIVFLIGPGLLCPPPN